MTGIALRTSFVTFGVEFGLLTIVVGHATFCVVIAYNNVIARLRRLPRSPEEASADLGADVFTTFRRVTLPEHGHGAAVRRPARLRAVVRRDHRHELHGRRRHADLPMWIYSAIQRPVELPVVNVVALVLILVSVIPVYIATRLSSGVGRRDGPDDQGCQRRPQDRPASIGRSRIGHAATGRRPATCAIAPWGTSAGRSRPRIRRSIPPRSARSIPRTRSIAMSA